ncbi:MAG: hypothetical protein EA379_06035 [Phycisphaerales bacterium]|nr:MAG: hypothetical protein EA379_06035 [Phycisphaerales bacterium]
MRLIAYRVGRCEGWDIVPAPKQRAWMNATPGGFANRCLPLTMANHAGWIIRSPAAFIARWNGDPTPGASITFEFADERSASYAESVRSHFGSGIITLSIPYLFRTEPGVALLARGAPNEPKPHCAPLEGLVETDWSPSTFTMNWMITTPHADVEFRVGDPLCFLQPVRAELFESCEPETRDLASDPELHAEYTRWTKSRNAFIADPERGAKWQKDYHTGRIGETQAPQHHRTALKIQPFRDA